MRALRRRAGGKRSTSSDRKITLSMPSTVSSSDKVANAIQPSGDSSSASTDCYPLPLFQAPGVIRSRRRQRTCAP